MFTRLGLPMNHYTISFFLQKAKTLSLALPTSNSSKYCRPTSDPLISGPRLYSRIETARHLVRSDFFLQRSTQNFEIRKRVPRVKKSKLTKFKKNTHTPLSLSLSLSTCRSADARYTLTCLHQSLSLSLPLSLSTFANTVWIQIRPEWYSG